MRMRILCRKRRVERPAGVDAADDDDQQPDERTDDVEVPAQKIDLRKRQILRTELNRQDEIPQDRRNGRDQEKENHDDAVEGEELVIRIARQQITLGRE